MVHSVYRAAVSWPVLTCSVFQIKLVWVRAWIPVTKKTEWRGFIFLLLMFRAQPRRVPSYNKSHRNPINLAKAWILMWRPMNHRLSITLLPETRLCCSVTVRVVLLRPCTTWHHIKISISIFIVVILFIFFHSLLNVIMLIYSTLNIHLFVWFSLFSPCFLFVFYGLPFSCCLRFHFLCGINEILPYLILTNLILTRPVLANLVLSNPVMSWLTLFHLICSA